MKQTYNTALYMRLSRDDETYGDSVSIESQRTILRQYATANNLNVVDEYIDDGWSGTNFDRPAFKRMIEDVESGKINCIVTKDLSRFGREHIMMDYYLEFVFPEKKVRYVAVAENEDTENGLSDFVPFKNLFNEWYAKDTSRKTKQAFHAKFLAGERMGNYAPFGYKKHPEIKNKIIPDEETAPIVIRMFEMAAHGTSLSKIMNYLVDEKIPVPSYWEYSRFGGFARIYDNPERQKNNYLWRFSQVQNILRDETYIGNTVHFQHTTVSYKNKKVIRNPKEKWMKVENTHEPIVSKETFDLVQQQMESRKKPTRAGNTQIFAGLIKCADCGKSMRYCTNKKTYTYFTCTSYSLYGKEICSQHYIRYDTLYPYILSRIQFWTKIAQTQEEVLLKKLVDNDAKNHDVTMRNRAAELAKSKKRKAEVDRLFAKMYEDWVNERITEYNFNMMSERYQTEQQELDEKIRTLEAELSTEKKVTDNAEKWIAVLKQYSNPTELTAELLNTLVEKILIHETEENSFGETELVIDIIYRFVGKID